MTSLFKELLEDVAKNNSTYFSEMSCDEVKIPYLVDPISLTFPE